MLTEKTINFPGSAANSDRHPLTFRSPQMHQLVETAIRYARGSAAVLITGESGTGKELFSRLIHQHSPRASQNLVSVHCAAITEPTVDAELFGLAQATTVSAAGGVAGNAQLQRCGHFQAAHGGSILLDEVAATSLSIQTKLLRVIEEQQIRRVGSHHSESINVRIIATSNQNLHHETAAGNFRLDLFHRLNVLHLNIPPLRERASDIPPLVHHFFQQFRSESSVPIHGFTTAAMQQLCQHTWPGNVRELRNVIRRACIDCTTHQITVDCLPSVAHRSAPMFTTGMQLAEVEKGMILSALKRHRGNKTAAAAELGVTARTLSNKLKLYEQSPIKVA